MKAEAKLVVLLVFCLLIAGCGGGGGGGGPQKLVVGEIEGPAIVNEGGTAVQYHISASGDSGITYQWAVNPASAGTFKVQGESTTAFIATAVLGDTTATIRVVVSSDHSDPILKEKGIQIKDVEDLTVSQIQGPTTMVENSTANFSITASGDTGITYQWDCSPSSAGSFTNPKSPTCAFNSGPVSLDTAIAVRVTVNSDNYGPVVRSVDVQIKDVDALFVGQIEGPTSVLENSSTPYSVPAGGDTGITYLWECEPGSIGTMTKATSATATFVAETVTADTPGTIRVTVESDNYGPVTRTLGIQVIDANALTVGDIQGPTGVDEDTTVEYTISAGGDTGIQYSWECEPAAAGTFFDPSAYSTPFHANPVDADLPTVIRVTVTSDNYSPEIRTLDIVVEDVVLEVGYISGPGAVGEDSSNDYSVAATGDTGITYLWTCEPATAGTFTDPTGATATFNSGFVGADTSITIRVTVDSDNYGPEARTMKVTIVDNEVLWVGEIEGPAQVDEDSEVDFTVSAINDSGITYLWECDPPSLGSFTNETEASATFHAAELDADTPVAVQVTVNSDHHGPEVRSKDVQIMNLVLLVGDITGPASVNEDTQSQYGVTASGDTEITYLWECDPADAGSFTNGDKATATFNAGPIWADTPCTIQVTVDSAHNDPVVKTLAIDIWDTVVLEAGQIEGPATVDEKVSVQYSITAVGDTGLSYAWTVDPPSAGSFVSPSAATTAFNPVVTGMDVLATIRVAVSGDHYSPEDRSLDIRIRDLSGHGWARTWGSTSSDLGNACATDQLGNMYVLGTYQGTVDFDPGPGIDNHTSNGGRDIFLSKLNASGYLQWSKTWGGTDDEWGWALVLDGAGSIYVTGRFQNTVDFDPGSSFYQLDSMGYSDAFLSKFDASGSFMWANVWGGSSYDEGCSVALDLTGNIYVAGFFRSTVDFDPTPSVEERSSSGYEDVFVSKFDSTGDFLWVAAWGGSGNDYGYGVAVDASSNVYVTGDFEGSVDFDPGPAVYQRTSHGGGTDAFLSKLDSSGALSWAWNWDADGCAVTVDNSGNLFVTGYFYGTVDFDPSPGVEEHNSNGDADVYLSKFSPSGTFVRAVTWGGSSSDVGYALDVDQPGYIYVTGFFRDSADFDPGPGVEMRDATGLRDCYVSKFDSGGGYIWARAWGGTDDDYCYGVAAYGSSFICVTGYFGNIVDFDPGSWVENHESSGAEDAFLLKLLPNGTW